MGVFRFLQSFMASKPRVQSWGGLHEAIVHHIVDGDTIDVLVAENEQIRVRLECIDCPEGDQPWGVEAKDALAQLIGGKNIYLEVHGQDSYDRVLATVYAMIEGDLVNINERLVMLGHAWSTGHKFLQINENRRRQLMRLEKLSRLRKLGLWNSKNPTPPWEWRSEKYSVASEPTKNPQSQDNRGKSSPEDTRKGHEKFIARRNTATNKAFLEWDSETLIGPEGREIDIDAERFGPPEELPEVDFTEKQLRVFRNKLKELDAEAGDKKVKLELQKMLFSKLKLLRYDLAKTKNLPAYYIFDDKTLWEMAEIMPDSEASMLEVHGVGPTKLQMYGQKFLNAVKKFKEEMVPPTNKRRDSA